RILDIVYTSSTMGFDGASCGVSVAIGAQSPDIAQGVDAAYEARVEHDTDAGSHQSAGDQGLMFGYACDETPSMIPLPIDLSHRLAERLTQVRKDGTLDYVRPDGKTQASVVYTDGRAAAVETVVVSTQHADGVSLDDVIRPDIERHVINPV